MWHSLSLLCGVSTALQTMHAAARYPTHHLILLQEHMLSPHIATNSTPDHDLSRVSELRKLIVYNHVLSIPKGESGAIKASTQSYTHIQQSAANLIYYHFTN